MFGKLANSVKSAATNAGFAALLVPHINKLVAPYGGVKSLAIEDKKLRTVVTLNGLEDTEIYAPNMPFVENALNNFAVRTYDIPEGAARLAVAQVRGLFG